LQRRPIHFCLVVDPSDLLGLLLQTCSKLFNLFLLFLNLSVRFDLVENLAQAFMAWLTGQLPQLGLLCL
jgi:hypothetical protein